jgi:hypothetical protein
MELRAFSKLLYRLLCLLLAPLLVITQFPEIGLTQQAGNSGQASTGPIRIAIVEGDGAINNVRQRVARETIVQVNDENNRPVAGALVTFALPNSGAGGSFPNGGRVANLLTDRAGRAVAPRFTPNNVAGDFQINVTASYEGQTATSVISQTNATAVGSATSSASAATSGGGGISGTVIGVIVAVAGAVATAAVVATRGKSQPQSKPTITIGAAGGPSVGAP